jgi:hypothetical protein
MIAMDLARELKVAGLPWQPHRGDLAMDRLNIPYIVIADGADDAGGVQLDTVRGVERKPILSLTWIPRVDQMLAFLGRFGPVDVSLRPAGEGRRDLRWRVTLLIPGGGAQEEAPRQFEASDGGDATGKALHFLLAECGWRPGPPLPGESR